ncbi:MAG: alcohol dehydrogenase catalytic domain-containing protein [Desulfofustis sp.]|nr:alcohol dehydrogenase catalytic domain-containing protein [Desulfofustis sp.]
MIAVEISDTRQVTIIDKPEPNLEKPDDVIVKIKSVSICGTDVHTFQGEHPFVKPPVVVGHECGGEVVECGSGVKSLRPGDRVAIDPVLGCGNCRACRSGRANACADVKCRGVHVEGAMQEYFRIRERDVHKLPDNVADLDLAAVVEPMAIGAQACWRGSVREDQVAVIFGAGPIGIAVMLNAHCLGARTIIIDMKQDRLQRARDYGALAALRASDPELTAKILELTDGEGPHMTCDAVGHPRIFEQCIDLVAPTGHVVLLGMDSQPNNVTELQIFKKEMSVVGSRMNSNMFPTILDRVAGGQMHLEQMVSHRFTAGNAAEAFTMAVEQPEGFLKAMVTF